MTIRENFERFNDALDNLQITEYHWLNKKDPKKEDQTAVRDAYKKYLDALIETLIKVSEEIKVITELTEENKPLFEITCHEAVTGDGSVCWEGEATYMFDEEEALSFIKERLHSMGREDSGNLLYDENNIPTEQHRVTYTIHVEQAKGDIRNDRKR